jgi:BNR repeat-like domain
MSTLSRWPGLQRDKRLSPGAAVLLGALIFLLLAFIFSGYGRAALARSANAPTNPNSTLHFTTQERIGFQSGDDWEPDIAADRYGHLYTLFKHYDVAGGQTCQGCNKHLLVQRSDDSGKTWSAPRALTPTSLKDVGPQFDAQIMVDPVDGRTVWVSYLQNNKSLIAVQKSTDFGQTWSAQVIVSNPLPAGLDKDELAVQGKTILVAFDDNRNTWASVSNDGGKTWTVHEVFPTSKQFSLSLSADAAIDAEGTFYISWDSFDSAHRKAGQGPVTLWVSKSSDDGATWTRTVVGYSPAAAPLCTPCGFDYLSSQMALRIGSDDTIYVLWNTNVDGVNNSPQRVYFARSIDHGRTYSAPVDISDAPTGVEHCFPAIAVGQGEGDVRIAWMDERTGAWNVFFRSSTDGGLHLGKTIQVSGFVPGYPYLGPSGFALPYGDYQSMVVDDDNQTQMAFGEGPSYAGPGNQWVSHSTD